MSVPRIQEALDNRDAGSEKPSDIETRSKYFGLINQSNYDIESIHEKFTAALPTYEVSILNQTQQEAESLVEQHEYEYILILDSQSHYTLIAGSIGMQDQVPYIVSNIMVVEFRNIFTN